MSNHNVRQFDFRMSPEEMEKYQRNGFVVSERLGAPTFGDLFYRIYTDHLPVFVSADSILHAWHKTFDYFLESLEENVFLPALTRLVGDIRRRLLKVPSDRSAFVTDAIEDVDVFLTVALSLLTNSEKSPKTKSPTARKRVTDILAAIENKANVDIQLFGKLRSIDFSQFTVRGHYTRSEKLSQYFLGQMWCGFIDLEVADPESEDTRELMVAVLLYDLVGGRKGDIYKQWAEFDDFFTRLIGVPDSMSFKHLADLLDTAGVVSLAQICQQPDLVHQLRNFILTAGDAGVQAVASSNNSVFRHATSKEGKQLLPRSFTFLGQKFVLDSWVTGKCVYDRLKTDAGDECFRKMPHSLDVAYTALGSDAAADIVVDRMNATPSGEQSKPGMLRTLFGREGSGAAPSEEASEAVKFRDGYQYANQLGALRSFMDSLPASHWNATVYNKWLDTLRTLGAPMGGDVPATFQSGAWARKDLNTQLGSWAQLRHDTILYVKQSCGFMTCCDYPSGYVEPRPQFWRSMSELITLTQETMGSVKGNTKIVSTEEGEHILSHLVRHLDTFKMTVDRLGSICDKQMKGQQLSGHDEKPTNNSPYGFYRRKSFKEQSDTEFLKSVMEESHGSGASKFLGWYPQLFPSQREACADRDYIVADVHTDHPDPNLGSPGGVLHEAVGNVNAMLVSVPNRKDPSAPGVVYAGPVFSYYEFVAPPGQRVTDEKWAADVKAQKTPAHPTWKESFHVAGPQTQTWGINFWER
eukprot:GFYU01000278.1.p1 GENE.GFYU01000278.1~~GFYU01000278.1.p1  ORF type:complete len:847 (+),score=188.04 GFYU01000278.1:290-2542(+)